MRAGAPRGAGLGRRAAEGLSHGHRPVDYGPTAHETPSGRIGYREQGNGPVALFVHGVLLNGYLWRHQLAELSDIRRCIA